MSTQTQTNTFLTRATAVTATLRPWGQLLSPSALSRPVSFTEAKIRTIRNVSYYRANYTLIVLILLFLSLLWHPLSMIVFLLVFVAWFFLYFSLSSPLVILGRTIDDRFVLLSLSVVTIVALVLTRVWLNVLVSVLIGVGVVVLHAAFRGTEDLYSDDLESAGDGRLFSFVGSGSGYTPI